MQLSFRLWLGLLGVGIIGMYSPIQAQSKRFITTYTDAKQAFVQKKYDNAQSLFREVLATGEQNLLTENAHMYLALAYLKAGQTDRAEQVFQETLAKYPNSKHQDAIRYSLGEIDFRKGKPRPAIDRLSEISSSRYDRRIRNMKGHYLSPLPIQTLETLYVVYPKDTLIGQLLVDKIAATSEDMKDMARVDELIAELNLEEPPVRNIQKVFYKRPVYKVAVVLPFDYLHLKQHRDTSQVSDLAIHMYQGIRMAQIQLDSVDNIPLKLYAYDIGRGDSEKLDRWALEGEFDDIDLMVGPLYDDQYLKMTDLAAIKSFNIVNPISSDDKLLSNRFSLLYQPSIQTQAKQTADYVNRTYANKKVAILFDNLARNKNLAHHYRSAAEEIGMEVSLFEEVSTLRTDRIQQLLNNPAVIGAGSIFIASTSQLIGSESIRILKGQAANPPVFVPDAWHKFQSIEDADYEATRVHFITPLYLDTDNYPSQKFKESYQDFAFRNPEDYAYIGYELMRFFGKVLYESGSDADFRSTLRRTPPEPGLSSLGLNYQGGNDNQALSIFKLEQGRKVLVTKLEE